MNPLRGNGAMELSLREFTQIALYFDLKKREKATRKISRQSWGFKTFNTLAVIEAEWARAKFNIYEVRRGQELFVLCEGESGGLIDIKVSDYVPPSPKVRAIR